jgi:CO/xanthine dehydrogenase FAD-binding subunit
LRAHLAGHELRSPATLAEALQALAAEPGVWKPLAGGTDLMVLLAAGKLPHRRLLNLWGLAGVSAIEVTGTGVSIGALVTYSGLLDHPVLSAEFPLLCQAAALTGAVANQNRGTLGGNIANASPAADSPPALLAYDAVVELVSLRGARQVPYHSFHRGYKQMDLAPDELIARILLPRPGPGWREYGRKVGPRRAQAIAKVGIAGRVLWQAERIADVRIAYSSVAPYPLRCLRTEDALRGRGVEALAEAQRVLAAEITPIDDIRSTAHYRLRVAQNLLAALLGQSPSPLP